MQAKQKTKTAKHCDKWKFAIGTTSRAIGTSGRYLQGKHYLMFDVDEKRRDTMKEIRRFLKLCKVQRYIIQLTPNGYHVYTNRIFSWKYLLQVLTFSPCDRVWLSIGRSRGYFFLADKDAVILPWPVERMVIYHGKA